MQGYSIRQTANGQYRVVKTDTGEIGVYDAFGVWQLGTLKLPHTTVKLMIAEYRHANDRDRNA